MIGISCTNNNNFTMQRTIVALKKSNTSYKIPKFSECLLDYFGKDINSTYVNCRIENGNLILEESENGHELKHSPQCPFRIMAKVENQVLEVDKGTKIGVAASVVIESSDSHILLTRRTPQMRSSPNVWVTPGGHMEAGETIIAAGIREVKEETGLDLKIAKNKILGLWENTYPFLLGIGTPKNHILTVYIHASLNETHEQLTKKIVPNPEEVSSYCWLSYSVLKKLFESEDTHIPIGKQFEVFKGQIVEKPVDYYTMFNRWLWRQSEPYSGVNYGLRKWLEKKFKESLSSKI